MMSQKEYDLLIVGGGIFGVCAAWDAVSRGLSVAIVEKGDFAHATSANSLKMIHGGIRYLQHADWRRVRLAVKERRSFFRVAPHLTYPLPIMLPLYGHGLKGREIFWFGSNLYDVLAADRNRSIRDKEKWIPRGRMISATEALRLFPALDPRGLTGALIVHDGQMYSPTRLALSFLRSAVSEGVDAANYVAVTGFLKSKGRVSGARTRDVLTAGEAEVRAKVVLNAAGPWAPELIERHLGLSLRPQARYSRDACMILSRRLPGGHGVAIQAETSDPDSILRHTGRRLFMVPWRQYSLLGVWHRLHSGAPEDFLLTQREMLDFLAEVNAACPALHLSIEDVSMWNAGLVLTGDNEPGTLDLRYAKQSRIVDHAKEDGLEGMVTLLGARYSTAKIDAARAVDVVFRRLERTPPPTRIHHTPVHGGGLESFNEFLRREAGRHAEQLTEPILVALLHNYGTAYTEVLELLDENRTLGEPIGRSDVIKAQVVHAARNEMAHRLGDVVFRRTQLATGEHPGAAALRSCAELMACELRWDVTRLERELRDVTAALDRVCVTTHQPSDCCQQI